MEYTNLADILAPVIYHLTPKNTLARLEALFHKMIRADLGGASGLVLPDLLPLTELKVPEMWFPLRHNGGEEDIIVRFQNVLRIMHEANTLDRAIIMDLMIGS
jgi:hypothetical protein